MLCTQPLGNTIDGNDPHDAPALSTQAAGRLRAHHLLLKKDVIFWLPSPLDVFAALPLLVALLVPCFFAGVFVGETLAFFVGDGEGAGLRIFSGGPVSAVLLSSSASLRSRLIPF